MKILYISHYFPPEVNAPAVRVFELSRHWVKLGHQVTVLTGFPNHPTGTIPPEYQRDFRRGSMTEERCGIQVVRTWLFPFANGSPIKRMVNYFSFFASACLRGMLLSRPDVVIGTSPQLLVGLVAFFLSKRFRCRFVFEVRDLWPESLPAVGVSHEGSFLYKGLQKISNFLYRQADWIIPVSPPFKQHIRSFAPQSRITVIENGVDTNVFKPIHQPSLLNGNGRANGRFIVSYIGTIGFAHGLNSLLCAAELLKDRCPNLEILLIGEGAERKKLEAKAEKLGMNNVRFLGLRPRNEIPEWIALSDVCLVLLRNSKLFETVLPSKMLEFMACGKPVIGGVGGLTSRILEKSQGGIGIPPEQPELLADAILKIYQNPSLGKKYGENGRLFIHQNYQRETKAASYLEVFKEMGLS